MSNEQTPIEMAIEALDNIQSAMDADNPAAVYFHCDKAISALRAMPTQESAEPVAEKVDELVDVVKEWERVDGHEYYDDPEIWNSLHPRIKAWFGQQ